MSMLVIHPPVFFENCHPQMIMLLDDWMRHMDNLDFPAVNELLEGDDPYSSRLFDLMIEEIAQSYEDADEDYMYEQANHVLLEGYEEITLQASRDIRHYLNHRQLFYVLVGDDYEVSAAFNSPAKEVW